MKAKKRAFTQNYTAKINPQHKNRTKNNINALPLDTKAEPISKRLRKHDQKVQPICKKFRANHRT